MNKTVLGAAALLIGTAMPAAAQEGFYVNLGGGSAMVNDTDITYYEDGGTFGGAGAEDTLGAELDFNAAFALRGSIGYDFGMVRADVEVDYSRNKVKGLTVKTLNGSPVTLTAADGDDICDFLEADDCSVTGNTIRASGSRARQLTALANIWVDLPIGDTVVPYVGGGLGVGGYELDGEGKAAFAWQLGAGVAFKLSDTIALTADYRYRQLGSTEIAYDEDAGLRVGKVKTSTLAAGVRFTF